MSTGISWCTETWNPLTGCSRVSEGCRGCYAARDSFGRLSHLPMYKGLAIRNSEDGFAEFTGEMRYLPERLYQPLRWKKPRLIFVNSMSDLFHASVPIDFQQRVFDVMEEASHHTFQVLTKRPQLMRSRVLEMYGSTSWPSKHIWLGTSIESDVYSFRANHLRSTPSHVRFLSCEPLLGALHSLDLSEIDWCIVGAESGSRARPMDLEWVREIRDKCMDAGVALHVKQLTGPGGHPIKKIEEFPEDLRIQEYPA